MFTARFLRLRGFFGGVAGLCWSAKKGCGGESLLLSPLGDAVDESAMCNDGETFPDGDSGDGPGEGSVTEEESTVETVVVGEESEESEFEVDVLSR